MAGVAGKGGFAGAGHSLLAGRAGAVGVTPAEMGVSVGAAAWLNGSGMRSEDAGDEEPTEAGDASVELHALKTNTSAIVVAMKRCELRMRLAL